MDSQIQELNRLNDFIYSIPYFDSFIHNNSSTYNDVEELLNDFLSFVENKVIDVSEIRIMVHIAIERYASIIENSDKALYYINSTKRFHDESILSEFIEDLKKAKCEGVSFKKADIQHYKTITEKIAYQNIDFKEETIKKYWNCSHPYICSIISSAFINAKQYRIGLRFLKNGLSNFNTIYNKYWDNTLALKGCSDLLHLTQYVLGLKGMHETIGANKILEILYLYISRVIYMGDIPQDKKTIHTDSVPQHIIDKINYLSIRADLVYDYRNMFAHIFPIGVNPDIQFMADKYMSNAYAQQFGLEIITEQNFYDSLKMYRHGALIPNHSGGYHDIEDATWGELIDRGTTRAYSIAYTYFKEYKKGNYQLSTNEIDTIISYLDEKFKVISCSQF